ncbi:MAG: hypothetical protein JWO36_2712 [Myxococcales bacterium]|nr:hypothetical protein [Myxococcales bacterium]
MTRVRRPSPGSAVLASRADTGHRERNDLVGLPRARRLLVNRHMRTITFVILVVLMAAACGDGGTVVLAPERAGCAGSGIESVLAFALILVPLFRGMRELDDEDAQ